MTDTLQRIPAPAADRADAAPAAEDEDDLGCGCCTRPPSAVADKVAQLEARREMLERRLRGLGQTG